MTKEAAAIELSSLDMENKNSNIIDEYKKLEAECDKILETITKRQSKKLKK